MQPRSAIILFIAAVLFLLSTGLLLWSLVNRMAYEENLSANQQKQEDTLRSDDVIKPQETTNKSELQLVIDQYNAALLSEDFSALYPLVAKASINNITREDFVSLMKEQVAEKGEVVAIEDLTEPKIQSNDLGFVFFTIDQRITGRNPD